MRECVFLELSASSSGTASYLESDAVVAEGRGRLTLEYWVVWTGGGDVTVSLREDGVLLETTTLAGSAGRVVLSLAQTGRHRFVLGVAGAGVREISLRARGERLEEENGRGIALRAEGGSCVWDGTLYARRGDWLLPSAGASGAELPCFGETAILSVGGTAKKLTLADGTLFVSALSETRSEASALLGNARSFCVADTGGLWVLRARKLVSFSLSAAAGGVTAEEIESVSFEGERLRFSAGVIVERGDASWIHSGGKFEKLCEGTGAVRTEAGLLFCKGGRGLFRTQSAESVVGAGEEFVRCGSAYYLRRGSNLKNITL